ncbi:hypothetical protein FHT44_003313 [Mycolicibacterium sp. BK634]|uniref:hypothetical protein n=1 Tax=Mycolicibacterium sp. BK634 TaxID=2587099 RepID=UPI00161E0A8E|nr:hypothetical protein [Mycolicibacterium sp. BK634]MBB3750818.1 hypothetical protein [Mycolicibacterium sp. BK634]
MSIEIEIIEVIEELPDGEIVEIVEVVEIIEADKKPRNRVVRVDNKDNGETVHLRVPLSKTIDDVIAKTYDEFRATRRPDDRLTCRGDGVDVFQYGHMSLEHYLREGHCPKLHWAFAGGTGGA